MRFGICKVPEVARGGGEAQKAEGLEAHRVSRRSGKGKALRF